MSDHSELLKKASPQKSLRAFWRTLAPAAVQIEVYAICAILAAAPVAGGAAPFALALAAAVPPGFALAAGAGAVTGYAAGLTLLSAARYLSAVCAVALVRWLLQRAKHNQMIAAAVGSAALFTLQLFFSTISGDGLAPLTGVAEVLMTMAMTWLFLHLPTGTRDEALRRPEVRAAALVLLCGILAGLSQLSFLGMPAGVLAGLFYLLAAGYTGGEREGAFACAALIGSALVSGAPLFAFVGAAFSGLVAALFGGERKNMAAMACCASLLGLCIAPTASEGAGYLAASLAASAVFLLLPQKVWRAIPASAGAARGLEETAAHRLTALSRALREVKGLVNDICSLQPKKKRQKAEAPEYVCNTVCGKCEKNTFCWIEHYNETIDVLNQAHQAQRKTGYVCADGLPRFFQYRCDHVAEVCGALAKSRAMELTAVAAEARTELLRNALNDQYSAVADSLEQLAGQVLHEERLDAARTQKVAALFREMELQPLEAAVTRDTNGRFQVRVRTQRVVLTQEEEQALEEEVSHCCSRVLRLCTCEGQGAATSFVFLEQALLHPVYAESGSAAQEGVSADVAEFFCDESGHAHMLLCDGMGTGRSAAVDGKMAALLTRKLLLAGFGCDAAARLVNVALQLKGHEEGGAALDAFSVDLYTGKGALFKAGAAPTFILHGQEIQVVASDSLPVGTASGTEGILSETQLTAGDVVVLVSDGVLAAGESRVKEKLVRMAGAPAEKIARELAAFAKNQSVRADDITVAVLLLEDAGS